MPQEERVYCKRARYVLNVLAHAGTFYISCERLLKQASVAGKPATRNLWTFYCLKSERWYLKREQYVLKLFEDTSATFLFCGRFLKQLQGNQLPEA